MHLEKRKNSRLDWGIVVLNDHNRRMTRDISEQGCFIRKDEQVKDMVKRIDERSKEFIGRFVRDYL